MSSTIFPQNEEASLVEQDVQVTLVADNEQFTLIEDGDESFVIMSGTTVQIGATQDVFTAGADLGGHRAVYLDSSELLQYATNADPALGERVLGITSGAIANGATGVVLRTGEITEPSWNWTLGLPIFLGVNGQLTQTRPTTSGSFVLQVAFPIAPTKVFVDIKQAIFI